MVKPARRGEAGFGLLMALMVLFLVSIALALLGGSLQLRMRLVREDAETVILTALSDAAVAEAVAHLAQDPNYPGESAHDFGHGKISTFFRVIVPSNMPGIVAGTLLVFIPAVGDFVTPELLGGVHTRMFGNTIEDQFLGGGNNWPLGSAMAVLLMLFILVGVFLYLRRVGEEAL